MKQSLHYLFAGFAILLFFSDCTKKPIDRRNKYTGNWQFQYTVRSLSKGSPEVVTTSNYSGEIFYDGQKDKKHFVHFKLAKDWEEEFEIDKDGALIQCEKRGEFVTEKSLTINGTSAGCRTQLGAEISYTITGTR